MQVDNGKAMSKALRGFYLVDSALRMILFNLLKEQKENSEEPTGEIPVNSIAFEDLTSAEIDKMTKMYEELNDTDFLTIEFDSNPVIKSIKEKISALRVSLSEKFKRAQLWFEFSYVGIAKLSEVDIGMVIW